nr:cysteine-rich protein 1 isoform X1 [Oryctolagus cuniculus]
MFVSKGCHGNRGGCRYCLSLGVAGQPWWGWPDADTLPGSLGTSSRRAPSLFLPGASSVPTALLGEEQEQRLWVAWWVGVKRLPRAPGGWRGTRTPAERVTSLGKDWHRPCLKCEKCGKTLTSGGHAEHEGKPYCNHPCYSAMFGPKGFGRGGAESHTFK